MALVVAGGVGAAALGSNKLLEPVTGPSRCVSLLDVKQPSEIRFVDCVLDTAARRLMRAGKVVPLEPKMFQLLTVLIERRPAVVTNNELDELLWPDVYVARTSLARIVSELRTLIGDTARSGTIIRTVYKCGYAFAAAVATIDRSPASASDVSLVWDGQVIPLPAGEHIAGRAAECSVVVDATTVSRRHARITVGPGGVTIEDLASTNGTWINRQRISEPQRLNHGDRLVLGDEALTVRMRNPSGTAITTMMAGQTPPVRDGS